MKELLNNQTIQIVILLLLIPITKIVIKVLKRNHYRKRYQEYYDYKNINRYEEEKIIIDYNLYSKKYLLTKNEWRFYKDIKHIAERLGYCILAKIRMADLVEVKGDLKKSEWQTYFNKINKKHIDFALCNPDNLKVEILIELDDSTHKNELRKERDKFIEQVYSNTGYKLLRVKNAIEFEQKIECLNYKETKIHKETTT